MSIGGLRGREHELHRLATYFDDVRQRESPPILVVEGVTGIGKSRLLLEAVNLAQQQNLTVRRSVAEFWESSTPGTPQHAPPFSHRSLLVLDDEPTEPGIELRTLRQVLKNTELTPPPGVLLAQNGAAQGPIGDRISDELGVSQDRLQLAPLRGDAARAVVQDLIGVPAQQGLLDAVSCAGGNPRLIVELVEGLMEEERVGAAGDLLRTTPRRLPRRVRTAVNLHLARLSDESVQLLRVGTILGRSFQLSQAAAMLQRSVAALLPPLNETVTSGLLAFTDEGLTFEQPLVWRAVYESIPETVRAALHLDARHITSGSSAPTDDLVTLGREEIPRRRWPSKTDETSGALRTLLATGYVESAVLLVRTALNGDMPEHEKPLLSRLAADIIMATRHSPAALSEDVAIKSTPEMLSQAQAQLDEPAPANAGEANPDTQRAAALAVSSLDWAAGYAKESTRWGRAAVDVAVTPEVAPSRPHPYLVLAHKMIVLDDLHEASKLVQQAREDLTAHDAAIFTPVINLIEAYSLIRSGDFEAAGQQARAGLESAEHIGLSAYISWAEAVLALVALRCRDHQEAARHLGRCRELDGMVHTSSFFYTVRRQWLDLLLHELRNEIREAEGLLATSHSHLPALRPLLLEEPGAAAWFVRFSRMADNPELADRTLRAVEQLAVDNPGITAVSLAASHARSLFECDPEGLAQAAAEHQDHWARACATNDLETLLKERQVDSREFVRTRGIITVRDRVGSMRAVDPEIRPDAHEIHDVLGPAERTIAEFVSQGLTNRQVAQRVHLSPHTVNYHLRRIFRKLGVRSRTELARYFHTR